jgi:hypothetical protein
VRQLRKDFEVGVERSDIGEVANDGGHQNINHDTDVLDVSDAKKIYVIFMYNRAPSHFQKPSRSRCNFTMHFPGIHLTHL